MRGGNGYRLRASAVGKSRRTRDRKENERERLEGVEKIEQWHKEKETIRIGRSEEVRSEP